MLRVAFVCACGALWLVAARIMTCCPGCACQRRAGPDVADVEISMRHPALSGFSVDAFFGGFSALTKFICNSFEDRGEHTLRVERDHSLPELPRSNMHYVIRGRSGRVPQVCARVCELWRKPRIHSATPLSGCSSAHLPYAKPTTG